jgi:tetratricopeptide (TPR) repeat protein
MDMLGDFSGGQELYEKGLCFALEIKDLNALSILELDEGLCLVIHKGDGENGIKHAQNCIRYCEEGQILVLLGMAWMGLGWGHYLLGEMETSREYLEKGLKIQSDTGMPYLLSLYYCALSMINFDSGALKRAQSCAEEALRLSQDNHEKWPEGLSRVLLGRTIGKGRGSQYAKAEEYILQGIKIFHEVQLKPLASQGYLYLGELYNDNGQKDKALETLKKAEGMMQEMGMDYWLRRTQEVLERVQGKTKK